MSLYVVDIHGDIEGDYEIVRKYEEQEHFPKGATNGDAIKAMFPSVEVKEKNNGYEVYFGVGTSTQFFNHQWWNAPYKA